MEMKSTCTHDGHEGMSEKRNAKVWDGRGRWCIVACVACLLFVVPKERKRDQRREEHEVPAVGMLGMVGQRKHARTLPSSLLARYA